MFRMITYSLSVLQTWIVNDSSLCLDVCLFCHAWKVTHGAIQFTAYEELRKAMIFMKTTQTRTENRGGEESLNSIDFAALGAGSKVAAILLTYPYQVIRARLQQRPGSDGTPKYSNSWHVVKETAKWDWLLLVLLNLKLQNVQTVLPYHSLMLNIGQILSCLSSIYAFYCVGTWCV